VIPESRLRPLRRRQRVARAVVRNALAVWHEFKTPIVIFVVAVFGGGWIYGELLVQAGHARIPYVDLPYTMLALMILETPSDLPAEVPLVLFWYAMPIIGIYVAGRGVFDVFRLFFNPDERKNAWEEALASTYRHHVIVLGVGHLGLRVVRALVSMGVDVVAIDLKASPDKESELKQLDVPLVLGDGRLRQTLETAGVREAQAFIVCTSNDYMNIEVTMRARDLNPDVRIVVRVWEDQFSTQIQRFMNVAAVLSATDLAAPSFAGSALGIEITQTMTVDGVEYSMIRLTVAPGSFLDGAQVGVLQDAHNMDIVLHKRSGDARVHPARDATICAGDTLVIFAQHHKITDVVARNAVKASS
jgi:Trk K+ transport system NAD-binding subunit